MGLLSRLSAVNLNADKSSFDAFLKKFNIDCIFELKYYSYYYFCSKSFGLDADSILQSNSSKDFWDGLITKEHEIFNFFKADNSIAPFLQLFSQEQRDTLEAISIYKYSEDSILVLCNKPLSDEIISGYPLVKEEAHPRLSQIQAHIDQKDKINLFSIDFTESVENIGEEKLKNNESLKIEYEKVLYNELFTRLQFYFSSPSAVARTSKSAANILFISKSEISQDLILSQLIKLFSKVTGASAELISFNFLGQSHSITEIKEFLKVI